MKNSENPLVRRYEEALARGEAVYFDSADILDLYSHYRCRGTLEQTLQVLDYGLRLHPNHVMMKFLRANQLVFMNRLDEVEQAISELEAVEPDRGMSMVSRGAWLARTGHLPEAVAMMDEAFRNAPAKSKYLLGYFSGFALMDAHHFAEAVPVFEKTLQVEPGNDEMTFYLACCFTALNKLDKAVELYKTVLDGSPYEENAWFNLGNVYIGLDEYEKAVDALEYVLTINPNNSLAIERCAHAYYQLGIAAYQKADMKEAAKLLGQACELNPGALNITFYLAVVHYKLSEPVSAAGFMKEMLDKEEDKGKILTWFVQACPESIQDPGFFKRLGLVMEIERTDEGNDGDSV
jgi:tetratricopeptide (TPR) repeat protein